MKRRTVLTGITALATGSGLTVSTGAFSGISAKRRVDIAIVDDYEAYLSLQEIGEGGRSVVDGGQLTFQIPGAFEDSEASGLGSESVYRFGEDANTEKAGLFEVVNQGTNPIRVYSSQSERSGVPNVTIYSVESGEKLNSGNPSELLEIGDVVRCGLEIDTHGVDVRGDSYELNLNIHGRVDEDDL
jgi:hypothetical protein